MMLFQPDDHAMTAAVEREAQTEIFLSDFPGWAGPVQRAEEMRQRALATSQGDWWASEYRRSEYRRIKAEYRAEIRAIAAEAGVLPNPDAEGLHHD